MSKIVKVGRENIYFGKLIFEILCELRDFGRNRIVESISKSTSGSRTFYIIHRAFPQMDEEYRWGRVYAEEYIDGKRRPGIIEMNTIHEDYRLVHRHEESPYREIAAKAPLLGRDVPKIPLPKYLKAPPVLAEVINRKKLSRPPCVYIKGLTKEDYGYDLETLVDLKLEAKYKFTELEELKYRVADEDAGEKPSQLRPPNLGNKQNI